MYQFKGKLIKLLRKRQRLPNGRVVQLEIIEHPGAVLVIPFLDKNKIVFIRQFRPVIKTYLYELPAGTIGRNEKPLACAKREIIEEIGYKAGRLSRIGKIYPVPGYSTEVITIFKADRLIKTAAAPELDEIIKVVTFNKNQIRAMFKKGQILDSKTISALAYCGWL